MNEVVRVELGARSYEIHVGRGLLERGAALAAPLLAERRVFVVTDDVVADLHAARLEAGFAAAGVDVHRIVLPAGERTKTWAELGRLLDRLLDLRPERRSILVALGGGVVGGAVSIGSSTAINLIGWTFADVRTPARVLAYAKDSRVAAADRIDIQATAAATIEANVDAASVALAGGAVAISASGAGADVRDARAVVDLRGDLLQDRRQLAVAARLAARHQARAVERPFLAARHAHAGEAQSLRRELALAPLGVVGVAVAGVDDQVARLQVRQEGGDGVIDRLAGLDQQDQLARPHQRGADLGRRACTDHALARAEPGERRLGLVPRTVEDGDREAVAGDVEGQVLAHDGEADDGDLGGGLHAGAVAPRP